MTFEIMGFMQIFSDCSLSSCVSLSLKILSVGVFKIFSHLLAPLFTIMSHSWMGLEYHGLLLTYAEKKGAPWLERLMHDKGEGSHYEREMK